MKATLEAVFEHGVFKPVERIDIPEGERVKLTVERVASRTPDDMLDRARRVYEGLSPDEIDDIEHIALDRSRFFSKPSP